MPQFVTIKAGIKWFLKIVEFVLRSLMYFICGYLIFCSISMFMAWRVQPGVNEFFPDGQSWLHHAAGWTGSEWDMKWYLFWGADINLRGVNDMTPIFYAVKDDKLEHVKFLYQKGANIHLKDSNGFGLIHYASSRQMLDYLHERCYVAWEIYHYYYPESKSVLSLEASRLPQLTAMEFDENGFIVLRDNDGNVVEKVLFWDCDISPKTYDERDSEIRTSKRKIQWFANGTTLVVYQILATDDWSEFMSHMPVTPCCIHLEICDKQIDNKDVEILSQITHEVHLSLTNCATTPGILASLQMSNLHSLHLTHCNFAVEDFPFLSHCSNLHALYLVSCTVNSEIFRIISQLPLEQLLIVDVKPKLNNNFTRRQAGDSASPRWGENDEMPGGVPSRRAVRTDSLGVQHFRERR